MPTVSTCSNAGGLWNRDATPSCWTKKVCITPCGGSRLGSGLWQRSGSATLKFIRFASPDPNHEVLNLGRIASLRHLGYCSPTESDILFGVYPVIDDRLSALELTKEDRMRKDSLRQLYVDELKDLYSAETQIVKTLPKLAKASSNAQLRQAFERHLRETSEQVSRLEQIFDMLEEKPTGRKCLGMEGLVKEGSGTMQEAYQDSVMDAALIGAAQRVEHYEIAGYGTVRAFAELLGGDDDV